MTTTSEISWTRLIRRYVHQLISLVFLLGLIAAGYISWHESTSDEYQRLASDYHLASSSHYLKAIAELRHTQSQMHYDRSKANIETGLQGSFRTPEPEYNSSISFYLIQQEVRAGLELQHTFADGRFDSLTERLEQELAIFEESGRDYFLNGTVAKQVVPAMRGFMMPLNQLVRLHTIVRDDLQADLKARERHQALVIVLLVSGLLLAGFLITKRGLGAINAVIIQQKEAGEALSVSKERFRALVESTSDWIWELDSEANFTYASPQVKELLGYEPEELVGKMTGFDLMPPMEAEAIREKFSSFAAAAEPFDAMTNVNLHRDGHKVVMESSGRPFFDAEGELLGYRGMDRDITERKRVDEALNRKLTDLEIMASILRLTLQPISLEEILRKSLALVMKKHGLGLSPKGAVFLVGKDAKGLVMMVQHGLPESVKESCGHLPLGRCLCGLAAQEGKVVFANKIDQRHELTYEGITPHGHYCIPIQSAGKMLGVLTLYVPEGRRRTADDEQFVTAIADTMAGAIQRRQAEEKLKYMATHDSLTELFNRKVLEQRIAEEVQRAVRYSHVISAFMLDIDHFKPINDTYGHQAGDTVLQCIARILESSIRSTDCVARYGGEEFVVILPETPLALAEELAERLRIQIEEYSISIEDGKEFNITASIGVSTFPQHGESWGDLLNAADSAMYAAKDGGRNCVRVAENTT